MVVPGTLFEELGFNYIGPVDGHDVLGLINTLKNMRDLKGPQFLHIMTKKGRGYEPAEKDPITFHAVPKFDPTSGTCRKAAAACRAIRRFSATGCAKWRQKTAS
jgi:1-deoxy-D-xylulose-5-phosphate synthase